MKDVPDGYREIRIDRARAVVREHAVNFVREAVEAAGTLYEYAAMRPDAETLQGRRILYVISGPGADRWVIRHLSHGGALAPLTRDRFLRWGGRIRPFNELRIACRLRSLGIPTPEILAAVAYPAGLIYRGEIARDEVPEARDLASCLFEDPPLDPEDRVAALAGAGRLIRWLHTEGVIHPDLNLRNILIEWTARPPRPYILDLEKCRIVTQVPAWRRRQMLRRIRRSARKFERFSGEPIREQEWRCFEMAYRELVDEGR